MPKTPQIYSRILSQEVIDELRKLKKKDEANNVLMMIRMRRRVEKNCKDDSRYQGDDKRNLQYLVTPYCSVEFSVSRLFYKIDDPEVIDEFERVVKDIQKQLPPHDIFELMAEELIYHEPSQHLIYPD